MRHRTITTDAYAFCLLSIASSAFTISRSFYEKEQKEGKREKIIFFRSLEPIETMFATKLDGYRSADCWLRAVMK